jgi:hypothetical protein
VLHLMGAEQTRAVREWMRLGLCICPFLLKGMYCLLEGRRSYEYREPCLLTNIAPALNWSARRRRKLVQCPCGAFFSNDAARELGLCSESEWKRAGFPRFKLRDQPYEITAPIKNAWHRHVRRGPQPRARIWRAFYDFPSKRFTWGLWSVDLFTVEDIDTDYVQLTTQQCLEIVEGFGPLPAKEMP